MMDIDWEAIMREAIRALYEKDSALFRRDVHEVAISHRLAIYLEQILKEKKLLGDCSVDIEYNRNLYGGKYLSKENERPDILVHKRGNHERNLLIIEIKKKNSCEDTKVNDSDDRKLKVATSHQREYKYGCGLFLSLNTECVQFTWYSEGEPKKTDFIINRLLLI